MKVILGDRTKGTFWRNIVRGYNKKNNKQHENNNYEYR